MNSKDQLLDNVLKLADALSSVEKLAECYDVPSEDAMNTFMESILDIVILHNSDGTLLGLEIMMTYGGPTIWIETRYSKVVGVWGSDRVERSYEDGVGLDELIEDIIYSFR